MFINYEHNNNVYNVSIERRSDKFYVTYDNTQYIVQADEVKPGQLKISMGDRVIKSVITEGDKEKFVFVDGQVFKVKPVELTGKKISKKKKEEGDLSSPISGKVITVKVKKGDSVKKGDELIVIEAMKMEYIIRAPYNGKINKINFKENDQIEIGQITAEMDKKEK